MKLHTLIADLLNYGAEAQKYVGYKTDALVNEGLTVQGSTVIPTEADINRSATASQDAERYAVALGIRFDYVNKIYVKLNLPSADGIRVFINNKEAELERDSGNTYIAYSEGIYTTEFDTAYSVYFTYNDRVVQELTYSANSYAYAKYNSNEKIRDLALALFRLGISSDNYSAK